MSDGRLIGYRVVAPGAGSDLFDLRQAAEQCVRLLRKAGRQAGLYEVTELSGVEHAKPINVRRQRRATTRSA